MAEEEHEDRERFQLSPAQAAASSLAAMSAAVICSFFGVAGTIIGTAVTSLVATIGSALYAYSMRRTRARLRRLHLAGAASPPFREVVKTARQQGRELLRQVPWAAVGVGTGLVFVFSIDVITAIEGGLGESLAAVFGVSHAGDRTTSFGSLVDGGHHRHPKAKPSPSPSPSKSQTSAPSSSSPAPTTAPSATPSTRPSTTPTPSSVPTTSPPLIPIPTLSPSS